MTSHYERLGVAPDATLDQIRAAYRHRALELHPDRNPSADAAQAFVSLHAAYEVLTDADARQRYDYSHGIGLTPEGFTDPDDPFAPPRPTELRRRGAEAERGAVEQNAHARSESAATGSTESTLREMADIAHNDVARVGARLRFGRPAGWVIGALIGGAAVGLARWVSLQIGFPWLPVAVFVVALATLITVQTVRARR